MPSEKRNERIMDELKVYGLEEMNVIGITTDGAKVTVTDELFKKRPVVLREAPQVSNSNGGKENIALIEDIAK